MKCEDIIEDAHQLCEDKDFIHDFFKIEIKRLEHLIWKYKSMDGEQLYDRLIHTKRLYNTIQHLTWCVTIFSMKKKSDENPK